MQKLKLSSQKSFLNLGIVLFVLTTGFILFSCNKESSTPQVNTAEARSLQESEALQDANSDKMVNTAALGLLNLSKNAAFRELVHNKCNEQFDGDYNVLLKDVVTPAAQIGIDLKHSFLQSIQVNASSIEASPSKLPYGYFTDETNIGKSVEGYDYFENKFFLQIYVPNFEEGNVENRQPVIVVFPDDNQTCTPGAYVLDENGIFQPRVIDETFVKDNLIWVVSINERINTPLESNNSIINSNNNIGNGRVAELPRNTNAASERGGNGRSKLAQINEIAIDARNECFFCGRADVYIRVAHVINCNSLSSLGILILQPQQFDPINEVTNCIGKFGRFKMKTWCKITDFKARTLASPFGSFINDLREEEDLAFVIYELDAQKKKNLKSYKVCGTGYTMEYYSKDDAYHKRSFNYFDVPNYSPLKFGTWEDFDSNDINGNNSSLRLGGKVFTY